MKKSFSIDCRDDMKLTSSKALKFLEEARGKTITDFWIDHSICVGEVASVIALELGLDKEKAKAMGYIHDIGKKVGPFKDHIINGYKYLKHLGYDEEYCNICLTHSFLNNDIYCIGGGVPGDNPKLENFIENHQYTMYDKLITLSDMMCTTTFCGVEERLKDIERRYGNFENTEYHKSEVLKLKKYFDNMLGYDLYQLFLAKSEDLW